MKREDALEIIKSLEPQLRAAGVVRAWVFGSLARGETTKHSDIDIAVEPAPGRTLAPLELLDVYGLFGAAFGHATPIDVVVLPPKNQRLAQSIARDAIIAFQ